ncbi:small ribosomal subunit protein uS3m-like isoform X2 [Ruditapes philippinarum]|uniref:small ribosomal subunit protein uS3m-like isoform X2 n=1 Tax=Ruditapes philippinarum TaxID=129788 RepID=UPI00295A8B71|nr:small ribosomal subunit protein uS3m-like isoform X2 [Ruditapes philippinarum]
MDEVVSIPLSNRRFDWFTQTIHPIGPSFTDKAFTNMATFMSACKCLLQTSGPSCLAQRGIQTSCVLNKKHIRAGIYKVTRKRTVTLTYEEAKPPYKIGVDKSWLSWNTSNLIGEGRKSETTIEDAFIRRFMDGTWPQKLASDVIIKRRHNMIYVVAYIKRRLLDDKDLQKVYFLVGYTEELLSCLLKCQVKLELPAVRQPSDMIFKRI